MSKKEDVCKEQNESLEDKVPLVSLDQIYSDCNNLRLYLVNNDGTKLKDVLTDEIKSKQKEVKLVDVLLGKEKINNSEKEINDLRLFFKMRKQIGFNRKQEYDFINKTDINKLFKLTIFKNIQKEKNKSEELTSF